MSKQFPGVDIDAVHGGQRMGTKLNRTAYEALIEEDVARVEKEMPDSLERTHVIAVLRHSVCCYYPTPDSSKTPPTYVQGGWSPVEMSAENHGPVTIVEPGELVCALDPDGKLMGFRIPPLISNSGEPK